MQVKPKKLKKIRFYKQINNHFCGPATLQIVVTSFGLPARQRDLALRAGTDAIVGTSLVGMVRALRHFGLKVEAGHNKTIADLRAALRQHKRVIVCFTERHFEWGHYALVTGFTGRHIQLLDPSEKGGAGAPMTTQEFESRWHDSLFTKSKRWAAFVSATAPRPLRPNR